jgi:hypothetical protein
MIIITLRTQECQSNRIQIHKTKAKAKERNPSPFDVGAHLSESDDSHERTRWSKAGFVLTREILFVQRRLGASNIA